MLSKKSDLVCPVIASGDKTPKNGGASSPFYLSSSDLVMSSGNDAMSFAIERASLGVTCSTIARRTDSSSS